MQSLKLEHETNVDIREINSLNSKKFHINVYNCEGVTISNIHITAPGNSPNTDGIHLGTSSGITISDATIATVDDCISIGDIVTNINITNVNCGPDHGINIGSLGRYSQPPTPPPVFSYYYYIPIVFLFFNVKILILPCRYPGEKEVNFVTVTNCNFTATQNGVRIKTIAPSPPGAVSTITFQWIRMNNVQNRSSSTNTTARTRHRARATPASRYKSKNMFNAKYFRAQKKKKKKEKMKLKSIEFSTLI